MSLKMTVNKNKIILKQYPDNSAASDWFVLLPLSGKLRFIIGSSRKVITRGSVCLKLNNSVNSVDHHAYR